MTAWRYSSSVGGNWQAYLNYIDSTGLERVVSTFGAIVDPTTAHFKQWVQLSRAMNQKANGSHCPANQVARQKYHLPRTT